MRLTLTNKYILILFGALISASIIALIVTIYFMEQPINQELQSRIRKLQTIIQSANDTTARHFEQSALLASHNEELAQAIQKNDHYKVMNISKNVMDESGSDFMTVTDNKGIVVGRGHSEKWQDNVLNQETVVKALTGEPSSAIVFGTVVPFTIRASQPVMQEGKIVGTFSIGKSLVTPDYLDWLKETSGLDVSIFKNRERKMTTLMKDGERFVGYKINSPEIEAAVLKNGQTHFTQSELNGQIYETAYWPIRNANGIIVGMWGVGLPKVTLGEFVNSAIIKAVLMTFDLLLLQLIIFLLIIIKTTAPLRQVTAYAVNIANGNRDLKLNIKTTDELKDLANALRKLAQKQDELIFENKKLSSITKGNN